MTAAQLHAAIVAAGCHVRVAEGELVISPPPPPELDRYLPVLLTGVWAVATNRRWYGNARDTCRPCGPCPAASRGPLANGALDPNKLLPREVGLLSVGGEEYSMDRIPAEWLAELPEVFEPEVAVRPATAPAGRLLAPAFEFDAAG